MKKNLLILFFLAAPIFTIHANEVDVGVGVDEILEHGSKICTCAQASDLDRICIATTKPPQGPNINPEDKSILSGFEAKIVNGLFQIHSKAYYIGCKFDKTPAIFTDPALNEQFKSMLYYDFHGVEGQRALMTVTAIDSTGKRRSFGQDDGKFTQQKFYANIGSAEENYRLNYQGNVTFERPLDRVLSDRHIQEVLQGREHVASFKITLMIELKNGLLRKFGEYTLKVRFFKDQASIGAALTRG